MLAQGEIEVTAIAPGVIKLRVGKPDQLAPYYFFIEKPREEAMKLPSNTALPFDIKNVVVQINSRGTQVRIPLVEDEQLYGFGLQIGSFEQRGLRHWPIVNDNPVSTIGFTHAPQPFYVSSAGYSILINTARYVTFLCGSNQELAPETAVPNNMEKLKFTTKEFYKARSQTKAAVWADIPNAEGVELFFFQGANLKESVQRYNLFSRGGAVPSLWGLCIKYSVKGDFTQEGVMKMATYFRNHRIPYDVLGLEPGWHSNSYSCFYV